MTAENNKQIGRKEIIDTYVRYVRHRGDARVLLKQRLDAILSAFNHGMSKNVFNYFNSGILIDENCSEAKLKEIEDITGYRFEDPTNPFWEYDLVSRCSKLYSCIG